MNKDIRVDIGFFNHRKTKKLILRFGLEAAWGLEQLWAYAARHRCNGYLTGMSNIDIAMEMHVEDKVDPNELIEFMTNEDCRWIDKTENGLYLHDWHIHNPWAAKAEDRSDKARFSRMALTHPNIFKELQQQGVDAISREKYDELTSCQRIVKPALSPAPAPAPDPAPDPAPNPKSKDRVRKQREPFTPPTVEQVREYCQQRGNKIDPEYFVASNNAKGWVIGKNKTPAKDWKAMIITWEKTQAVGFGGNGNGKNLGRNDSNGERAEPGKYAAALAGKTQVIPE